MKAYSRDLREKIVTAYENHEGSLRKTAERFAVSLGTVSRLVKRFRQTGTLEPKPHGGGQKRKIVGKHLQVFRRLVTEQPDATLPELRERLRRETGLVVGTSTVSLTLKRLGYTRKKKTLHATERDQDEDVRKARAAYLKRQPTMKASRLIFIDETGAKLNMTRTYARAPKGTRAEGTKPADPGKGMSAIGALRMKGMVTAMTVDEAVDGEIFKAFVDQLLVPALKPSDTVLMDNLRAHKVQGIEEAIQSTGAHLQYLPPYSPELSPIEHGWSKLKESLRSLGARTSHAMQQALKISLEAITESDARGWFNHCGYCT